jgi:predicted N-acetyltransferase YhbS
VITLRLATAADAGAVAATLREGFDSYRSWAPADWTPPDVGEGDPERFGRALARPDVWFMVACTGDGDVVGHVALALATHEDPGPPPPGTVFLWQLFVRVVWHGEGVAAELLHAAIVEAARRGYSAVALWTLEGAGRARRFYEREGFAATGRVHRESDFGLPTIEYRRAVP